MNVRARVGVSKSNKPVVEMRTDIGGKWNWDEVDDATAAALLQASDGLKRAQGNVTHGIKLRAHNGSVSALEDAVAQEFDITLPDAPVGLRKDALPPASTTKAVVKSATKKPTAKKIRKKR